LDRFNALLKKELASELRTRSGIYSTLLFAVLTTTAVGFTSIERAPSPLVASALLWLVLGFASVTGLARAFIVEEDQRTSDLLRLLSPPGPVFWAKLSYNFLLVLAVAAVVVPLHLIFESVHPENWPLLIVGTISGCGALASGVTFCGSLVAKSSARGAIAGVICLPVLLPIIISGMGAISGSFESSNSDVVIGAWKSVAALAGLSLVFAGIGRQLFPFVWES